MGLRDMKNSKDGTTPFTNKVFEEAFMDTTDFQVIAYLLLFLGMGSSFVHYKSYTRAKAQQKVKER